MNVNKDCVSIKIRDEKLVEKLVNYQAMTKRRYQDIAEDALRLYFDNPKRIYESMSREDLIEIIMKGEKVDG